MSMASLSAPPVASPSISAGAQHSLTGSLPTKRARRRNCFRRCATARLHNCENPTIEDKETRPPPRYNEGTLIEAMQNAWRFVDDEVLRERLKEAKGIGTPATRYWPC